MKQNKHEIISMELVGAVTKIKYRYFINSKHFKNIETINFST